MTSDAPSFVNVHTPKTSFVIPHSFNLETIDDLFHKVTHKLKLTPLDTPVGLGWVKYEWNDSIWDLDDSSDYTILAWRLKSLVTDDSPGSSSAATLPHNSFPLTLHIRNPEDPLPKPPAYVNPSYYVYRRPASLSPSLSDSRSHNHDGMRTQSRAAGRSMKSSKSKQSHGSTSERGGTGVPQFKKDFMNFHSENGVRTVIGKIGPVRNVRMLLKSGYRHVYISRAFALKHGFIPADAAPGMYGYSGLVNIGKWPITVGKTTTTHPVYLSEESHFECVLGRSFMERRGIKTDPTDPTNVVCLDTGEKIDCEIVVIRDGNGEIVTVT